MRAMPTLVAVAALLGCGGAQGDRSGTGRAYVEEVQRACTSADEAFQRVGENAPAEVIVSAADEWRAATAALAKTEVPDARRAELERVVGAARELERTLRRTAKRHGTTTRSSVLAQTVIRSRSAADTLNVAAGVMKVPGCGEAAIRAADRLLTRPYASEVGYFMGRYRRWMRGVDFTPATEEGAMRSVTSLFNAAVLLDRGAGVLEPPRTVAKTHRRMIDAISPLRELTLPLGVRTERVGPDRAMRILRRAAPRARRLERLQRAVLAETEAALRRG